MPPLPLTLRGKRAKAVARFAPPPHSDAEQATGMLRTNHSCLTLVPSHREEPRAH